MVRTKTKRSDSPTEQSYYFPPVSRSNLSSRGKYFDKYVIPEITRDKPKVKTASQTAYKGKWIAMSELDPQTDVGRKTMSSAFKIYDTELPV